MDNSLNPDIDLSTEEGRKQFAIRNAQPSRDVQSPVPGQEVFIRYIDESPIPVSQISGDPDYGATFKTGLLIYEYSGREGWILKKAMSYREQHPNECD